jgi:hypothetical protein
VPELIPLARFTHLVTSGRLAIMRNTTNALVVALLMIHGLVACNVERAPTIDAQTMTNADVVEELAELPIPKSAQALSTLTVMQELETQPIPTVGEMQAAATLTPAATQVSPTAWSTTPSPPSNPSDSAPPGFTLTSALCSDAQGPDCNVLRLGDDYLTTTSPAKGYLYSCSGPNPHAPGATESKITWLDLAAKTWNFFKKLWLPSGTFEAVIGTYTETVDHGQRLISINNLPVDGMIGDWPMTQYPTLSEIDRNPGIPTAVNFSFSYPTSPSEALSPSCLPQGAIGTTTNGVVIYNAADARGEDAVAREIVDAFGGHPARSEYHYHFIPERMDDVSKGTEHSGVVGYINDGFAIYGYKGEGGVEMSNDDLDLCHGHSHGSIGYHYHATIEFPYTVGCYKGVPASTSTTAMPVPRR